MSGEVGILNVGAGDTKLSFDPKNPAERIRAARIVKDMIRRGYALLIEVDDGNGGKVTRRATDFDENTCEYIIADFDPIIAAQADRADQSIQERKIDVTESFGKAEIKTAQGKTKGRPKGSTRRVDAGSTTGVSVARTAGG
jgi:hypothetical protein